jgi:hypothetical protein
MSIALGLALALGTLRAAAQAEENGQSRPIVPGESGHILKMTREMVDLARSHDPERRMELFLRQGGERLREREALGSETSTPEKRAVALQLGRSYEHLVSRGAGGAVECGAAEGRDMNPAVLRFGEVTRGHHEAWTRVLASLPAEDRPHYDGALRAAGQGHLRAHEARKTGLLFLGEVRAKEEAQKRERERERARAVPELRPGPERKPAPLPEGPGPLIKRPPELPRTPAEHERPLPKPEPKPEPDPNAPPHVKETHHPPHPHRPHR